MSLKLLVLVFMLVFVSGCITGEDRENIEKADDKETIEKVDVMENVKEVDIMETIVISSGAFEDGGTIPKKYTCDDKDISPSLSWKGIPQGSKSIALIMDDPDAPVGTWVHWVIFNVPPGTLSMPEGVSTDSTLGDGSLQGVTDFGKIGYGGPCPPGGKPHRYYFKLYALDIKLNLSPGVSKSDVVNAMKGHILASGELMGKYGR